MRSPVVPSPNAAGSVEFAPPRGLHGHSLVGGGFRPFLAEGVGTCALVLTVISTAIAASLAKPVAGVPYGSVAVPLAAGLVLASLVAGLGPVSGAHFNPALTVGLAVNGRFRRAYVAPYLAAQLLGSVSAALIAWALYGSVARTEVSLGATYPSHGVGAGRALLAEIVVTFVLVVVIVSVASKVDAGAALSALAIGFALAAAIFISGPVSGGAVNPARALGPMLVSGKFTDWWVYLLGPFVGGVAAVALHRVLGSEQV